jgi:ABC-type uncharacterized transport system substrate-binding protein
MHRRWYAALVGLAACLTSGAARAHPHVFIKDSMVLIFDERDIVGVRMIWVFDEMYSSMIKTDYTTAKDGSVTPEDVKTIEQQNFSNLENFNFFVDLKVDGKPIRIAKVKDFDATFRGDRAVFEFTVPLTTPRSAENAIEVGVFDPEYFVEFTMVDDDPVKIRHGERFAAQCSVVRNVRKVSALGPVDTDVAECTYSARAQ